MKVKFESTEKVFTPFKFTIEIENKEEAIKFMVLLNHVKINLALDLYQGFDVIRDILMKQAGIKYEDYQYLFSKLDNLIK